MGINLSADEYHIVELLADGKSMHTPLSELEAAIYTVLLTRAYTGGKARIIRILQYFNPGTSDAEIGAALDAFQARKLVEVTNSVISVPDNWDVALAASLKPRGGFSEEFLDRVERCRRSHE